jgi:ribonuclease Z
MKVVFLGTGGTYPSKRRNVSSVVVQLGAEAVMFDCGEGTQRQLLHSTVSFMRISAIFITHLHADHFLGLAGLVQSMSLNGRERALAVYGPAGCARTVETFLGLGHFKSSFGIYAADLEPGVSVDLGVCTVRCASADHTVPALAFALEEGCRPGRFDLERAKALGIPEGPLYRELQQGRTVHVDGREFRPRDVLGEPRRGRKLVYTGDTRPSEAVTELSRGADVLIHDCTMAEAHAELAHEFGHSTATDAAVTAKSAEVARLFLVHVSPRYEEGSLLEEEARKVFPDARVPEELSEHDIPNRD